MEDSWFNLHIYRREIQCLNNFVMDIIIICPEAVIWGDLKFEWSSYFTYIKVELKILDGMYGLQPLL